MEAVNLDTHPHILLAEDDFELRELLTFALERAGYLVSCCTNGSDLLERLRQQHSYNLVITDLCMPALSGLEVLDRLRDCSDLPPVICMTAFGDKQTHDSALRLGAVASIDKPFDLDELIELAASACLNHGQS